MSGCRFDQLDGAYVLGALPPEERAEFEAHLPECAACADGVRRLAGLPGLLARVDPADLTLSAPPPPPTVLPALVGELERRSRRRRFVLAAGGVAAAASFVAAGSFLGGVDHPAQPSASPPATVAGAPARAMVPIGQQVMTASVALESVPWGTRLDLTCSYAGLRHQGEDYTGPTTYSMVLLTGAGRTQRVATWTPPTGTTMHLSAATALPASRISGVEIRNSSGAVVLRLAT